jgi:hypothetical protein
MKELSEQEANVQVAIVTGVFAFLGILTAGLLARKGSHPKTPSEDPDLNHKGPESLLSTYSGEQNDFMRLVIQDSKTVHERLDRFEGIVEQMKKERTQLIGAFTRYISKLVDSWGSGGKMPYPDDEDFKILEETLPADWRRRTK